MTRRGRVAKAVHNRELSPAKDNIWYALATIDGQPAIGADTALVKKNKYYWNGYMRHLHEKDEHQSFLKYPDLINKMPQLGVKELGHVHKKLQRLGFDPIELSGLEIDFSYVDVPQCYFDGFIFIKHANFYCARFSGWAYFNDAIFLGEANFDKSVFKEWADFHNADFSQLAAFDDCTFSKAVSFDKAKFSKSALFSAVNFFGLATFNGANFSSELDFNQFEGRNATVFNSFPPEFFNANTPEDVRWFNVEFPSSKGLAQSKATMHKNAYERLGLMMDKLNKHHDKHMFFRLEMRARRQMETKWLPRLINGGYEFLSDYGYGVGRASTLWLGNIVAGTMFLIPFKGLDFDPTWSGLKEGIEILSKAFATSFSNAHGFLGLGRGPLKESVSYYQANPDLWVPYNVTAFFQTICGAIFLFFVLLCMRNRFRMG